MQLVVHCFTNYHLPSVIQRLYITKTFTYSTMNGKKSEIYYIVQYNGSSKKKPCLLN